MNRADKATLRLTFGLGASVLVAYGAGLPAPFALCVMAVLLLCKPGPPMPLKRAFVIALGVAALLAGGIFMVPVLEHYAVAGVLLTATVLYGVLLLSARGGGAITAVLLMAFTLVPVVGVANQAMVGKFSITLALGVLLGALAGSLAYTLFPDAPGPVQARPVTPPQAGAAQWIALRATLIVMPVFVLALINPSLYLAAIMKTVTLAQQVEETTAQNAGRDLVGSTLMGALIAGVLWLGLSLLPNLWMLMLWLMLAALWTGARLFGARRSAHRPSYWSNALITALILFGPAIEDSANGKNVVQASLIRVALFIAVSFYAWGAIQVMERWRDAAPKPRLRGELPGAIS